MRSLSVFRFDSVLTLEQYHNIQNWPNNELADMVTGMKNSTPPHPTYPPHTLHITPAPSLKSMEPEFTILSTVSKARRRRELYELHIWSG